MKEEIYSLSNYQYDIPERLIAQEPAVPRDSSGLLVINRQKKTIKQAIFRDLLKFLKSGDVLVLNNTKVIKARLTGRTDKGQELEVLLLKQQARGLWQALVKPGRRAKLNTRVIFEPGKLEAKIVAKTDQGGRVLEFNPKDLETILPKVGKVPLPPYIKKEADDFGGYQTVYAEKKGAVAAPTAGLHFTEQLIEKIKAKGVEVIYLTLHCSLATFRPVKTKDIRQHKIESEWINLSSQSACAVNSAKAQKRRVIAVGTTAIRTLESVAISTSEAKPKVKAFSGETKLYIVPGYKFKIVDAVITNFHTPCSTNLVLMASFCNLELLKKSYSLAKAKNMRFFSFGDAMLIV